MALFTFTALLALEFAKNDMIGFVPSVADFLGVYIDKQLYYEIREKGGWSDFLCCFEKNIPTVT